MYNLYHVITGSPEYRVLRCDEALITLFNCPLENKHQDIWSHCNYIVYVTQGRKIWHTAQGAYDLRKGSCVFIRKGAAIIEQFFDASFCIVLFFVPDEFICRVLQASSEPLQATPGTGEPILPLESNELVQAFFYSMLPYFQTAREPERSLLELKFRELILLLAGNPANAGLRSHFRMLLDQPRAVDLQQVMELNFCFNLGLEAFAQLSARSLSAFKRDFRKQYNTTPAKWLLARRLDHARKLLAHSGKTVSEAAFESGFENLSHFSRSFRQRFGTPPASTRPAVTS